MLQYLYWGDYSRTFNKYMQFKYKFKTLIIIQFTILFNCKNCSSIIYYIVVDIQKLLKIIKEDDEKVSTN